MLNNYLEFLNNFDNKKKIKLLKLSLENYDNKTYKSTRVYLFENILQNQFNQYTTNDKVEELEKQFILYYEQNSTSINEYLNIIMKIFSN